MARTDQTVRDQDPNDGKAREEKAVAEVSKSLHAKVRVIRDRRSMSIADAIEKYGGPGIEREYRKCVAEMNAEIEHGGEGG
jgi:hypothetical protein